MTETRRWLLSALLAAVLATPLAMAAAAPHCTASAPAYVLSYAEAPPLASSHARDADDLLGLAGIGRSITQLLGDGAGWLHTGWLRERAAHGDAQAQYAMALRYARGDGVPRDAAQAARWFAAAARNGNRRAANDLGVDYAQGSGKPQNFAAARHWLLRAAAAGSALGQYNLGVMFLRGAGVPRAPVLAAVWFKRAAEQGLVSAQRALAALRTEDHAGLPADLPTAYFWLSLAKAAEPDHDAECMTTQLQVLQSRIGPTATRYAQRAAQSWWRAHYDTH